MDTAVKTPKISVLMPVYNGEKYLKEAIESVLYQDFTDFEFLIINDGSTDSSTKIISSYTDARIRIIDNEKNIGLVGTLNKGLDLAKGEYIARMDCDDISIKSRLSVQVKLMDSNKNIGASGSFYRLLRKNKKAISDLPINNEEIKAFMIFNSPIAHPSAIIRSSILKQHNLKYDSEYIHCEDYNLWSQISEFSQLANTADVLLEYRVHENQITGNAKFLFAKSSSLNLIRLRHLKLLDIVPNEDELAIHNLIGNGEKLGSEEQLKSAQTWLKKIVQINNKNKAVDETYFEKIILERWLRLCFNFLGWRRGFSYFYKSEIYREIKLPVSRKLELFRQIYYSYKRKN
jgi:glycosyltransferase involved in cell wall biosynthesis